MWHITLPGIKSTVVTLLILNLGRVMGSNLERLTALENSQVKDFQYQLAVYIYNKGIGAGKIQCGDRSWSVPVIDRIDPGSVI